MVTKLTGIVSKPFFIASWCLAVISTGVLPGCKTTSKTVQTPAKPPVEIPRVQPELKEEPESKSEAPPGIRKGTFVLIMPFELEQNFMKPVEEVIEPEISQLSLNALHFYEGALLAADSLKKGGVELKLHTFDTPSDSMGIVRLMTNAVVKEADVVMGSFPNPLVPVAASVARTHNIKLVLTQSATPGVLTDNENVSLAFTSTMTQCRLMVAYMMEQFPDPNIILIYRTQKREDELAAVYREEIQKRAGDVAWHDFNASKREYTEIAGLLSTTKRNLVFVISSGEAFVSPVLTLLEQQNTYGIKVSGLPTWLNFESVDFMSFKNIQTYLFDNNFIDYQEPEIVKYRKQFINRYYSDPLPSAYNGFNLVYRLGLVTGEQQALGSMIQKAFEGSGTSFRFESNDETDGSENRSISILMINNYKLVKQNR